jgi:glycosyltransferase involved in cell wall biosynthesis
VLEDKYAFELWILGAGEERKKLEQIIEEKNIKSVKLLGFQTNPYKFMKQADIYICSSLFEGYSTTVCEALSLGIPTLTTDCAGMSEILEDGKYGIIVENSEAGIEKGLKQILSNREVLVELKARLVEKAKQLIPETAIQEYENLFND